MIGRRRKSRGEIIEDERDRAILAMAGRIAFGVFWVVLVAVVVGLLALAGETSAVRVSAIVAALWFAWLLMLLVYSLSVLWMCRWQRAR